MYSTSTVDRYIRQRFIDDCLESDCDRKANSLCKLPTGHLLSSQIEIEDEPQTLKNLGRWTIEESYVYLSCLKETKTTKTLVKKVLVALPQRAESQIRAHHQKMLRKYGSAKEIIACLDTPTNYLFSKINHRLSRVSSMLGELTQKEFS